MLAKIHPNSLLILDVSTWAVQGPIQREEEKMKERREFLILKCDIACTTRFVVVGVSPWDSPEGIKEGSKGTWILCLSIPQLCNN